MSGGYTNGADPGHLASDVGDAFAILVLLVLVLLVFEEVLEGDAVREGRTVLLNLVGDSVMLLPRP